MNAEGKVVAVGVTGGIAAYKACEAVSRLKKLGADVHVVMTKNATQFVSPLTYETLSNNRVITDMFDRNFEREVGHIALAKKADLFLVAPATANFIGKFACGIADDFLSTTVMAAACPVLIAPAMNTNMLFSAAVRQNIEVLKARGVQFVEPDEGRLACGDVGAGRLAEPDRIVEAALKLLNPKRDYESKTVLVTAGATLEPIDPVRYLSNYSSGKMGLAIADAAARRGAKVIVIAGSVTEPLDGDYELIRVKTTADMLLSVMEQFPRADVIIKAAAPADYAVRAKAAQKLKAKTLTLNLVKNPDIAAAVGGIKGDKKLVIFSAETENLIENAREKLERKNADMVVANDVTQEGAGFGVDTNIATIITRSHLRSVEKTTKRELAEIILDCVSELK